MTNKQENKLLGTIIWQRNHAFSDASIDTWCFSKFPNFSESLQYLTIFFTELIRGIGWWQRCCLCSGGCEHPGTGRWRLRKAGAVQASELPYWRTTATARRHLCGRTGTRRDETTIFRLAVPTLGRCTTTAAGLHPNGDMCSAFLLS
jgi:hypothetical protein